MILYITVQYLRSGAEHCLLDILKGREEVQGLLMLEIIFWTQSMKEMESLGSNCKWD
jgi:hypothetical protein